MEVDWTEEEIATARKAKARDGLGGIISTDGICAIMDSGVSLLLARASGQVVEDVACLRETVVASADHWARPRMNHALETINRLSALANEAVDLRERLTKQSTRAKEYLDETERLKDEIHTLTTQNGEASREAESLQARVAELEAGSKLQTEHMRQRDSLRAEVERLKVEVGEWKRATTCAVPSEVESRASSLKQAVVEANTLRRRAESRLAAILKRGGDEMYKALDLTTMLEKSYADRVRRWVMEGDAPQEAKEPLAVEVNYEDNIHSPQEVTITAYDFAAMSDTPLYPCSPTCTHDDAATPDHPERVKERSEAWNTLHPNGSCTCAGEGTCSWCDQVVETDRASIRIAELEAQLAEVTIQRDAYRKAGALEHDRAEKYYKLYKKWKRRAHASALDFYEGFLLGHQIAGKLHQGPDPKIKVAVAKTQDEYGEGYTQSLRDAAKAVAGLHHCDNCNGVQPESCLFNARLDKLT